MSLHIRYRNCVIVFMCTFSEFTGQKRCVHTDLYVPAIRARMSDMCMNYPDVEFTMFKIVFCEILIMLGIKFVAKRNF